MRARLRVGTNGVTSVTSHADPTTGDRGATIDSVAPQEVTERENLRGSWALVQGPFSLPVELALLGWTDWLRNPKERHFEEAPKFFGCRKVGKKLQNSCVVRRFRAVCRVFDISKVFKFLYYYSSYIYIIIIIKYINTIYTHNAHCTWVLRQPLPKAHQPLPKAHHSPNTSLPAPYSIHSILE